MNFSDDVETVTKEEVVVSVNRSSERVFNGENCTVSDPEFNGLECNLELITRYGFTFRISFTGGSFAVRSRYALVSDAKLSTVHRRWGEVSNGERLRLVIDWN